MSLFTAHPPYVPPESVFALSPWMTMLMCRNNIIYPRLVS